MIRLTTTAGGKMSDTTGPTDVALPPPPVPPPENVVPARARLRLPSLAPATLPWLILAAVVGDVALRTGAGTVSSTVAVAIVAGPILGSVSRCGPRSRLFLILAVVFAAWLPVRASIALTLLNASAVIACLVAAAVSQRDADWRWSTATAGLVLVRGSMAFFFATVIARSLAPLRGGQLARVSPVARGIAIAAIPVAILTALLASADAVFAQSIAIDFDASSGIEHLVVVGFVAAAIAGLVAMIGVPGNEIFNERRPLGVVETIILLGAVAVLFAAFAFVQLISAMGGADLVLQEQGLSYAEYARSGFFQLLWVAALTAFLLGTVRMITAEARPKFDRVVRLLGAGVALLTTVIVGVAVVRLWLYTDEFGQTTLRWYCTAFAWMLGAGFVAIAAGHSAALGRFLPRTLLALVVATLLAVNVLNPEARVAEHNLARPDAAEQLDADYLARLSADAWPVLLRDAPLMASRLDGPATLSEQCAAADVSNGYGFAGFNLALQRLECG